LLGFDAIKNGQHALLQWQTADENNNKGFAIERSVDGVHFDQIGWVNAVVNPGSRNNYSFNDLAPVQGWNYYRFKQIDLDGKFTYSPQRKLLFAASSLWSVVHPVRHELLIRNNFATAMTINIFDAAGKQVLRTVKSPAAILRVNVASLQSGLYFVQLNGGAVQKFVKD
jgi:hypothetical protein